MALSTRIEEELNVALKGGEAEKVSVLRLLKSSIHNFKIAQRGELTDEDVLKLLGKEAKQRQESISSFKTAGRDEMAAKEKRELEIINSYLPEQLSEEALSGVIEKAIADTGAKQLSDIGKVMQAVNKLVKGQADGARIAQIVKQKLGT